jgi:nitrite reductase/ring-hydroxylating ferredoxin subunit
MPDNQSGPPSVPIRGEACRLASAASGVEGGAPARAGSGHGGYLDVGAAADFAEGRMTGVDVGAERVVVARVGGRLCAVGGICTHQIAYLEDGVLEGQTVYCPRHAAGFDLRSGEALHPPADFPLPVYDVKLEAGRLLISCRPRRP